MFQHGLTWPQALALALAGSYVRRELWTDKRLFHTDGGLVWVDGSPSRVVQSADFGREEFLAKDWTNMGFDQGHCLDPVTPDPTSTHIVINETEIVKVQAGYPGGTKMNPPSWGNPLVVDGRSYISRLQSRWSPGNGATYNWVNPITGALEPVTFSQWPAVPSTGEGPTVMLQRTITNPFSAPCQVLITGTATDVLLLNGAEIPLPASFQLGAAGLMYAFGGIGASSTATVAALVRNPPSQPVAALNIDIAFSL